MDKEHLLETAAQLRQISCNVFDEYYQKTEQLIAKMNSVMLNRPDLEALIGVNNTNMMLDNHANHVRFMASIFKNHSPEVLVDTVLWVFRAYRSHGFTSNYWAAQLNTWINILKEILIPASFSEVYPYYEWMQVNIPLFVKVSDEQLEAPNSFH
jgi:hypothetical protein